MCTGRNAAGERESADGGAVNMQTATSCSSLSLVLEYLHWPNFSAQSAESSESSNALVCMLLLYVSKERRSSAIMVCCFSARSL